MALQPTALLCVDHMLCCMGKRGRVLQQSERCLKLNLDLDAAQEQAGGGAVMVLLLAHSRMQVVNHSGCPVAHLRLELGSGSYYVT